MMLGTVSTLRSIEDALSEYEVIGRHIPTAGDPESASYDHSQIAQALGALVGGDVFQEVVVRQTQNGQMLVRPPRFLVRGELDRHILHDENWRTHLLCSDSSVEDCGPNTSSLISSARTEDVSDIAGNHRFIANARRLTSGESTMLAAWSGTTDDRPLWQVRSAVTSLVQPPFGETIPHKDADIDSNLPDEFIRDVLLPLLVRSEHDASRRLVTDRPYVGGKLLVDKIRALHQYDIGIEAQDRLLDGQSTAAIVERYVKSMREKLTGNGRKVTLGGSDKPSEFDYSYFESRTIDGREAEPSSIPAVMLYDTDSHRFLTRLGRHLRIDRDPPVKSDVVGLTATPSSAKVENLILRTGHRDDSPEFPGHIFTFQGSSVPYASWLNLDSFAEGQTKEDIDLLIEDMFVKA